MTYEHKTGSNADCFLSQLDLFSPRTSSGKYLVVKSQQRHKSFDTIDSLNGKSGSVCIYMYIILYYVYIFFPL